MRRKYFENPTQVAYWDDDTGRYIGGIGFGHEVICGRCGTVISIDDIYDSAPEDVVPIIIYNYWVWIDDFIIDDNERYFEREGAKNEGN